MSGSGNDFVMLDGRYVPPADVTAGEVRALCDRRRGAGADGVILLDPAAPAGTHFTFRFWNSDGEPGPMCGNGALCAIRLASLLELAAPDEEVVFATPAGVHRGRRAGAGARPGTAELQLPDCPAPVAAPSIRREPGEREPYLVNPSVPHLVLLVDDVAAVDLPRRGPPLRNDPAAGPGGANVNWVSPAGDGTFRMRTWERGVEGETLACGTGAVACALVLGALRLAKSPVRLWTRSELPLDVEWAESGSTVQHIRLVGEGRLVYRGIIGELPSH